MNQSEISFRKFDKQFIWDYRDNAYGADIIFTDRFTKETKVVTSYSLESAFEKVFIDM